MRKRTQINDDEDEDEILAIKIYSDQHSELLETEKNHLENINNYKWKLDKKILLISWAKSLFNSVLFSSAVNIYNPTY